MTERLTRTEMTDAVNSGLVESADKSERSLKGALYTQGSKHANSYSSRSAQSAARARKGAASGTGNMADTSEDVQVSGTKEQSRYNLRKALNKKSIAKGSVGKAAHNALEDSELEGIDDAYYKGKASAKGVKRIRSRLSGKNALEGKNTLGALSEKGYRKKATDASKAQMKSYFTRAVYSNKQAAAAKAAAKGSSVVGRMFGSAASHLAAWASAIGAPILAAIIALVLSIALIGSLIGGSASEEKSFSIDGMPAWVTYDLVLACLEAHEQYGYPASALLGQMMIENGVSDSGSELGRLYHNYGGIKYAGSDYGGLITGKVLYKTTEYGKAGSYTIYAYFSVFKDDASYMKYRCEHLYKQSNYTRVPNYQKAIANNDSALFLQALGEGGYYTDSTSNYVAMYRSFCKSYPLLASLDSMTSAEFKSHYSSGSIYSGGGQDYTTAEQWQKNIINASYSVGSPGSGLCAKWVSLVYQKAGLGYPGGNGNSMLASSTTASTDFSKIKVGQIISAQKGSNSYMGNTYGHVCIYIGNGKVRDNIGYIRETTLSEWLSTYSRGWVKYGWPW